jgi:hypothetical protein
MQLQVLYVVDMFRPRSRLVGRDHGCQQLLRVGEVGAGSDLAVERKGEGKLSPRLHGLVGDHELAGRLKTGVGLVWARTDRGVDVSGLPLVAGDECLGCL